MANEEYKVEGYGVRSDYDGPYHPSADYNPAFVHAFPGDPEKQEKYQNELKALSGLDEEAQRTTADLLKPQASTSTVLKQPEYQTPQGNLIAEQAGADAPIKREFLDNGVSPEAAVKPLANPYLSAEGIQSLMDSMDDLVESEEE